MVTKQQAIESAIICIGDSGEDFIWSITDDNWLQKRNQFLDNVRFNGIRSHKHIINVLTFMNRWIEKVEQE